MKRFRAVSGREFLQESGDEFGLLDKDCVSSFFDDLDAPLGPETLQGVDSRDIDDSVLSTPNDHNLNVF